MADPRPREVIADELLAHAQELQQSAHPYDNRNVLVPVRLFTKLTLLCRELQRLPTEIIDQE